LGCSPDTASKYKLRGFFPVTQVGQCSWVKIADAAEAVKNNPELALLVNNKQSFKKIVPRMITSIEKGSGRWSYIRLYYQYWHVTLCVSPDEAIDPLTRVELCRDVIAMQHKKKPFKIPPVDPVEETFWARLSFLNIRPGKRPAA
jgi:hypothetical protein